MYIYDYMSLRDFADTSCTQNHNTHFYSVTFFPKTVPFMRKCGRILRSQAGYKCQYNVSHTHCMMENCGHRRTLRVCNTNGFSAATIVTETLLNITFIPTMSALFNPYPTAFPYGNGMVLHFYQQQEISTTKTVHKVINKGLKAYV